MCKKAAGQVNLLRHVRDSIDASVAERIYTTMIMPVFTYCSSITLGWSKTRRKIIRNIEQRSFNVITKSCPKIDLRIPSVEGVVKTKACCFIFDCPQNNVCDIYEKVFERMEHAHDTRNNHVSVKLSKIRTEFGRKSFNFLAAKNFESRILFRTFSDEYLNCTFLLYSSF